MMSQSVIVLLVISGTDRILKEALNNLMELFLQIIDSVSIDSQHSDNHDIEKLLKAIKSWKDTQSSYDALETVNTAIEGPIVNDQDRADTMFQPLELSKLL